MNNGKFDKEKRVEVLLKKLPKNQFEEDKRQVFVSRLYNLEKIKEKRRIERSKTVSLSLAACLALFIVGAHFLMPRNPVLRNINGTVKIYRANRNEWIFADRDNIKIAKRDIVKTFEKGAVDIVLPNRYKVRLKNKTEIKLASVTSFIGTGKTIYELEKGRSFTYYEKSVRKNTFSIKTSQAMVSVIGTAFMTEALPTINKTWVGVLNGTVTVTGLTSLPHEKGNIVYVKPGEKTIVRTGSKPTVPVRLLESELMDLEELFRIGEKQQVALLISGGKNRVRELLSVTPLYISSDETELSRQVKEIVISFSEAIKQGSKDMHRDSIKKLEELVRTNPNPKYEVQFLLFIGAYYNYLGDHERSISTFRKVVDDYPRSRLASIAQCAIGYIYEHHIKDKKKALEAYYLVKAKYPYSVEMEEALSGIARLSQ